MDQSHIGIIGYGVVGRNVRGLLFPGAKVVDPILRAVDAGTRETSKIIPHYVDAPGARHYRVAFICVPTDSLEDGSADTSIVRQAIEENDADVFVVKSTVPPGTCDKLAAETDKNVVFSPEFYGATPSSTNVDHHFVILGGPRPATDIVAEEYKAVKDGRFRIMKTDSVTAELVKYAENAFLATKVTFFGEFHRLCGRLGVDTDEFRELLLLDRRIGRSHSFTFRDHPWYSSHCLDKDPAAIVKHAADLSVDMPLIKAVIEANEYNRRHFKGLNTGADFWVPPRSDKS
jgi:nucleotide sugar dehydrogenase